MRKEYETAFREKSCEGHFYTEKQKARYEESSKFHFRAFCLLYAFGFAGFLVTGFTPPQELRRF